MRCLPQALPLSKGDLKSFSSKIGSPAGYTTIAKFLKDINFAVEVSTLLSSLDLRRDLMRFEFLDGCLARVAELHRVQQRRGGRAGPGGVHRAGKAAAHPGAGDGRKGTGTRSLPALSGGAAFWLPLFDGWASLQAETALGAGGGGGRRRR